MKCPMRENITAREYSTWSVDLVLNQFLKLTDFVIVTIGISKPSLSMLYWVISAQVGAGNREEPT